MTATIPDLLRRFVPTPHGDTVLHRGCTVGVESNDATFAIELLNYLRRHSVPEFICAVGHFKIVIESLPESLGDELTTVAAGDLRILLRGTNTMLFYDTECRELLAFLAQDVSFREFHMRLLRALFGSELDFTAPRPVFVELQTSDNGSIAS